MDWKTNYEQNMAMATKNAPGIVPAVIVSNENQSDKSKMVITDFGTFSVLQLNKLLEQLPKNPALIDDYLTKAEKERKELKTLQKILDIFSKI